MKPLVLQGHSRPIKDIKFTAKGDIVFTASNDRNVIMWKTDTGEKVITYPHAAAVNKINLTCDLKYMITGDNTGSLYIWEIDTAILLIKLEQDPTYCIRSIDLTINDYLIMILYASRMKNSKSFICVYKLQDILNLATANLLAQIKDQKNFDFKNSEEIFFNNSSNMNTNDDFFDSFKASGKKQQQQINMNYANFNNLAPNSLITNIQSKKEAKNSINNIIINTSINNQNTNPNLKSTSNKNDNISAGNFKPIQLGNEGPKISSGSLNNKNVITPLVIDLTCTEAGQKLELFKYIECKTKETKYVQAKFSSLNKCLLVSREDGFLELINFNNGKLVSEFKFHTDVIMEFDIDSKNGVILTSSIDGYSSVINFDTFQVVNRFHPLNPTRNLNSCKIINMQNPFYDPDTDKKKTDMFSERNINNFVFNLFNPNPDKKPVEVINLDIDSLFNSAAMQENTKKCPRGINSKEKDLSLSIISGGQDSKLVTTTNQKEGGFDVLIYNSVTGELIVNFQDHFGPVNTLAINENAKILASGAEDATIRIYKLENYLLSMNNTN